MRLVRTATIRGDNAAASLKRHAGGRAVYRRAHPRRQRRGLIEAALSTFLWRVDHAIRGDNAAASLKHPQMRSMYSHLPSHPRRQRRGLIEAIPLATTIRAQDPIRGDNAAASLKLHRARGIQLEHHRPSAATTPRPH